MKLWLLRPKKNIPFFDVVEGFVIRAETERNARKMASKACGDEGPGLWKLKTLSTCVELTSNGPEEIIVRNFNSG